MKFKFSLQRVLDHRKIIEGLAQTDYQIALSQQLEEEKKLENMIKQLFDARANAALVQVSGAHDAAEKLKQIYQFTVLQDRRIAQQRTRVENSKKGVEDKQEILRQRSSERKIIDKLKEKKKSDFIEEQKREEQKEMDEMSILRFKAKDANE
jgi:flagellar protein FliJ